MARSGLSVELPVVLTEGSLLQKCNTGGLLVDRVCLVRVDACFSDDNVSMDVSFNDVVEGVIGKGERKYLDMLFARVCVVLAKVLARRFSEEIQRIEFDAVKN